MAFTKADLVGSVREGSCFSKGRSSEIVDTLLKIIKTSLAAGEDVKISGFGTFCVKEKKARRGRNPATGEDLTLKPRRVVTFKCSDKLRETINTPEIRPRCSWARTRHC